MTGGRRVSRSTFLAEIAEERVSNRKGQRNASVCGVRSADSSEKDESQEITSEGGKEGKTEAQRRRSSRPTYRVRLRIDTLLITLLTLPTYDPLLRGAL